MDIAYLQSKLGPQRGTIQVIIAQPSVISVINGLDLLNLLPDLFWIFYRYKI